jgi:N12 class adenine-specific DNA methylase
LPLREQNPGDKTVFDDRRHGNAESKIVNVVDKQESKYKKKDIYSGNKRQK